AGLTEERLIRGMHPLTAQRLRLGRLTNFELTRLPSAYDDVQLLRCVAPNNPSDERLVAVAQVGDLTSLRDDEGRILELPTLEGALGACMDAIREVREQRPANKGLDTNRIFLYVWPPSDLTPEELTAVVQRVVPATGGAGVAEILFLGRGRDRETGELTGMIAGPGGSFTEYDLDDAGALAPVSRPKGLNKASIVAGVAVTPAE